VATTAVLFLYANALLGVVLRSKYHVLTFELSEHIVMCFYTL